MTDNNSTQNRDFGKNKNRFSKKAIGLIGVAILLIVAVVAVLNNRAKLQYDLIRIHIRANSENKEDQDVKLKVRDQITEYLECELDGVKTHDEAYSRLLELQEDIKSVAIETLRQNGFFYGARVTINNEFFPTRTYEGIVVQSGYYDAVIVELGQGIGKNWWCVIYPPLCFINRGDYSTEWEYKSILEDIWHSIFG